MLGDLRIRIGLAYGIVCAFAVEAGIPNTASGEAKIAEDIGAAGKGAKIDLADMGG